MAAASPAEVNEQVGGEDAEDGLVVHYGPDGLPHAFEIEHASARPDLVARALSALATPGLRRLSVWRASTDEMITARLKADGRVVEILRDGSERPLVLRSTGPGSMPRPKRRSRSPRRSLRTMPRRYATQLPMCTAPAQDRPVSARVRQAHRACRSTPCATGNRGNARRRDPPGRATRHRRRSEAGIACSGPDLARTQGFGGSRVFRCHCWHRRAIATLPAG